MTDKQQLHAYSVTLLFGAGANGALASNAVVSPAPEMALANLAVLCAREIEGEITGVAIHELTPEWLRAALRAIEGGETTASVLSLVPTPAPEPEPPADCGHAPEYRTGDYCGMCANEKAVRKLINRQYPPGGAA